MFAKLFGLVPLEDWLIFAVCVGLLSYHFYAIMEVRRETTITVNSQWEGKLAQAAADARADHDAMQKRIDSSADTTDIVAKQTEIISYMKKLSANGGQVFRPKVPLPADCWYPDETVRTVNQQLLTPSPLVTH